MAEPPIHTADDAHPSKSPVFLAEFVLPLANSAAAIGDPSSTSSKGNAYFGAPYPSSCHFLLNITSNPHGGSAFQDSTAFSEDPNLQSRADFSCFAHPFAISAHPNAQLPSVRLREEQLDSTEPCGHYEDFTCPHLVSNDPNGPSRVICAGSAYAGTKLRDPLVQSSTESVHSCEESTSLHEECGDSTELCCGSSEDFTFSHAGYEDLCDDNEGFTYIQESGGDAANTHDDGRDPFEELVDPCFQEIDVHVTSIPQPCSSECSSVISLVTSAASEITSRLDNAYMSVDCIESQWTDAKHGSYLNFMETNFVKNLYGREYCFLDMCGQGPFHQESKGSSPLPSTLFEFKSWQSDDWCRRSMLKPPLPTCIPFGLHKSPWVEHLWHHSSPHANRQIKMENANTFRIDEAEEVNSPSMELHRGALSHPHKLTSKMGHEEKFLCKNGSTGNKAVGLLKLDGLQEFHDTGNSSFSIMKKRGFETDLEQKPSSRCKRGRSSTK